MKRPTTRLILIISLLLSASCSSPTIPTPDVIAETPDDMPQVFEQVEDAGLLGAALEANEKETYAGSWTMGGRIFIIAFTRDGEGTIKKYVKEGSPLERIILLQTMEASFAELQAAQQETADILDRLDLFFDSSIDIRKNRVELYVTDSELFNRALEKAGEKLPAHVESMVIYEPLREIPFPVNPDPSVHFPQLKVPSGSYMAALLTGKLVLKDGYLRVRDSLIIWQPDYFVNGNNGTIEILDREGKVVAKVGEDVVMGGGQYPVPKEEINRRLREPLPPDAQGPFWLQGGETRLGK